MDLTPDKEVKPKEKNKEVKPKDLPTDKFTGPYFVSRTIAENKDSIIAKLEGYFGN